MPNDRENRVALVTGGLRGLGKAMALGLAREGHPVVAVGHIESDIPDMRAEAEKLQIGRHFYPLAADLREAGECDRVVAATRERFGKVDILVNSAGLTFTKVNPFLPVKASRGIGQAELASVSGIWRSSGKKRPRIDYRERGR
jgi:NAD(P)-dependent dehydrogenase (short-subunit alcohol dehydrogenase family)